jgi:hypothetical protein
VAAAPCGRLRVDGPSVPAAPSGPLRMGVWGPYG